MKQFKQVAVGGTFDELHRGHEALLGRAFEISEKVVIGLSSDEFAIKMHKPHVTATYAERFKELEAFLEQSGLLERAKIVPLNDPYGLTISGRNLEALVVSEETKSTATEINKIRDKAGLPPLKIVAVSMVQAENCIAISTTRIRSGEIDRNGHLLKKTKNQ
jgi:pantetheine-phosphate adenylyltransferase